jgi:hypothetical protein
LFVRDGGDANFVPINFADTWLHLVLGIGLLGSWFVSKGGREEMATDRPATPPAPPA